MKESRAKNFRIFVVAGLKISKQDCACAVYPRRKIASESYAYKTFPGEDKVALQDKATMLIFNPAATTSHIPKRTDS
ncbi:MAG: hypothetical protein LBH06_05635 [Rikenellaceae bacterium]|nr:hypothetical protein [Rikenellaceae bacterium]